VTGRERKLAGIDRLFRRCGNTPGFPGESGNLARRAVGLGDGATATEDVGARPGCRRCCRKPAIDSMQFPGGVTRRNATSSLGGRSRLMSWRRVKREDPTCRRSGWPEAADPRPRRERLAAAVFLPQLANKPAGDSDPRRSPPRRFTRRQCRRPSPGHCWRRHARPRTKPTSTPSAVPACAPRGRRPSFWGDRAAPKVTLARQGSVLIDSGPGSTLKTSSAWRLMKKDRWCRARAGARPGDLGCAAPCSLRVLCTA